MRVLFSQDLKLDQATDPHTVSFVIFRTLQSSFFVTSLDQCQLFSLCFQRRFVLNFTETHQKTVTGPVICNEEWMLLYFIPRKKLRRIVRANDRYLSSFSCWSYYCVVYVGSEIIHVHFSPFQAHPLGTASALASVNTQKDASRRKIIRGFDSFWNAFLERTWYACKKPSM